MPWSAQPLQAQGDAQVLLGQKTEGVATLRRAAAKDPGDWEIWLDLAATTTGAEREAALDRAAALNPLGPEIADARAEDGGADGS